ncbi:hypothetical protein ACWDMZ_38720, partial [Streptomyces sp. NPDC000994]
MPSGPQDSAGALPVAQTEIGPVLRSLSLASGLVLIGLGLGLAFIALRGGGGGVRRAPAPPNLLLHTLSKKNP